MMSSRNGDGEPLTPDKFSSMTIADITEWVNESDKTDLIAFLSTLGKMRAFSWEDRMLLQMIEKSPFTFWASDKSYKVRLWAGKSSIVYARNMLGREFHEFISRFERRNAMADSIRIIDAQDTELLQLLEDFKNYYTKDIVGTKADVGIVTNSIQLVDEISGEVFYAEIGVPIDLDKALNEFNKRQKEFEIEISEFEKRCDELISEANIIHNELIDKINNKSRATKERKHELRQSCANEFLVVMNDIKIAKKKTAVNLDKFIADTAESIQLVKDKMDEAIDNETIVIQSNTAVDAEIKRAELSNKLNEKKIILINLLTELLVEVESLHCDPAIAEEHGKRIEKIRENKNRLSRRFSEYVQCLPQTPFILFDALEREIDKIEEELISYIAKERGGNN